MWLNTNISILYLVKTPVEIRQESMEEGEGEETEGEEEEEEKGEEEVRNL